MKKLSRKDKKRRENESKIVVTLDALDDSISGLRKFADRYNVYIDKAFVKGDDNMVKQLIKKKIRTNSIADKLEALKTNMELGAYSAKVACNLGTLPTALAGCKGLLSESPNYNKVVDSIQDIFKDISQTETAIDKINDALDEVFDADNASSLDKKLGIAESDIEKSDVYLAEMEALKTRVAGSGANATFSATANETIPTGDIDLEALIDEDKKRN